jgi:hypothetical protein
MTGIEFLAEAGALHPHARRLLMIEVGDVTAERPIALAMTLNRLEFYFGGLGVAGGGAVSGDG